MRHLRRAMRSVSTVPTFRLVNAKVHGPLVAAELSRVLGASVGTRRHSVIPPALQDLQL